MINICLACDENYSKHAGVAIASILANAEEDDKISFFILSDSLNDECKNKILQLKNIKDCEINFIEVDKALFKDYQNIKTHEYIPLCGYYRLKMATLLNNIDRVIYLDCDIVVNKSLKEFFNTDLTQNIIAGVSDINKRMLKKNPFYINTGVLLIDLMKIREQNIENDFLNWTIKNIETIKMGDQEIINEVLKGKIKLVDEKWNVQSSNFTNRSSYTSHPYIIHYVSRRKPWHFGSFSYPKRTYFKYLQLTPWALDDKEKSHWYLKNDIISMLKYIFHRPLFFLRPNFYKAFYYTYIRPY